MSTCKLILPKLWLAAIPKYWGERRVPSDYPSTNSSFSVTYKTPEITQAVKTMEENIGTENSIITDDMVPENTIVGGYLGTYEVEAVAGEETLLSPEKVSSSVIDVIAMHYSEETDQWSKIEDAHIVDGYVYGTLDSFSPIAVFTIKRDTIYGTGISSFFPNSSVYIANGIPVQVYKTEDGKTMAKDGNGKETEITANTVIIGGTVDGTNVDSTSISVTGAQVISVCAGSYSEDSVVTVGSATVLIKDSTISNGITGAGFNNRMTDLSMTVYNTIANFIGAGESWSSVKKVDSNSSTNIGFGSNTWVANSVMNVTNSNIYIFYASGNSGYFYADHSVINASGCEIGWLTTGGSNGRTNVCEVNVEDSTITCFQTVNRGTVNDARASIKNCTTSILAVCGDPTDSSVDGTVERVRLDITGGTANLYGGTNGGVAVDYNTVRGVVEYVKISRTSNITYKNDADDILGELIRLK